VLAELLARVRSALRRSGWRQQDVPAEASRGTLQFGTALVNFDTHEASAAGKPVRLTQLELDLLYYFSRNPGRVLSREELLERVWNLRNAPNTRSVDNFIARLRRYFEPLPDKPVHFLSHRGAGYKFIPDGPAKA
jgi:DNA-binding response OmpR family regulator